MGSNRELDTLAGLELGLDEGTNGVDGKEHEEGEDETVEQVEAGVSQLITDGFNAHVGDGGRIEGSEPATTTGLGPLVRRIDDSVLNEISCWMGGHRKSHFETNLKAVDELSERNVTTVTEHAQSLEVVTVSPVLELDADEVPLIWGRTLTDFDSKGGGVIGQTLKFWVVFCDLSHMEERNNGLVGSLNEQDLEGVPIEGDALQSSEDGVHGGASSDYGMA